MVAIITIGAALGALICLVGASFFFSKVEDYHGFRAIRWGYITVIIICITLSVSFILTVFGWFSVGRFVWNDYYLSELKRHEEARVNVSRDKIVWTYKDDEGEYTKKDTLKLDGRAINLVEDYTVGMPSFVYNKDNEQITLYWPLTNLDEYTDFGVYLVDKDPGKLGILDTHPSRRVN